MQETNLSPNNIRQEKEKKTMAAAAAAHSRHDDQKNFQKSYFDVLGICCPSEVPLIERILKELDGVNDVSVIVPTKTVIVLHDTLLTSQLQIVKALNKARLEASVRVKGAKSVKKKWPNPYAIASGICLCLSFLKYFYQPFQWLALGAVAFGIIPILLRAITALRNLTFGDINILVVITVVGSIALKDYWEAGTIVFLFAIGEWLESLASHKATAAMSSLLNLVPQRAILVESGEEVDVSQVKIDTVLAVKDGEIIPIDGVVVDGNCEVDEKTLTGESFPVSKQRDSTVWAGTINVNGYISVRTTALAEDCVVARMTKLVEEAQNNKSRIQRYMEKFAKYYTPGILLVSAVLAIVPTALRVHNQKTWYRIALVVLVGACPCALVLSTPVAMFCALTKAAKLGVFFKGADYFEMLAGVKFMAFDKTGTITRAEFEVTEFRSLMDDISLNTMLYWVSSIETKSSHPLAAALVDLAQSHAVEPKPEEVEQFHNFPGEGIYGKIDGKEIYIGNTKISARAGCPLVPKLEGNLDEGKSVGYIFLGSTPAGIFCLADICRTGAKEALKELKSMGITNVMLTGDCSSAAKHAQNQLEGALEVVHADLLPEDKSRIVKDFQKLACTAMIGDGINDAPALATADIGISMGVSGSALATETGHVILMTNDIRRIPKVAKLSRRVRRKILENIILSVATKGSIIALAIAGHPLIWAAVLADVGTCLLVIFNSMLLLRGTSSHQSKCGHSSAASLHNKHNEKCSGSDLSHSHQPCCHDRKPQKHCEAKSCSSKHCAPTGGQQYVPLSSISSSCGNGQSSESTDNHSCCGHGNDHLHKARHSDGGICSTVFEYIGGSHTHHHHEEINCSNSTRKVTEHSSLGDRHNKRCPGSDLSHANQPCCNDKKSQRRCEEQVQQGSSKNCALRLQNVPLSSTSNSCGNTQSSKCNGKHSCGHTNQIQKAKCSDHGSCKTDVGTKHHHGQTKCCNSTKRLDSDSVACEGIHEMKQCHHENHSITSTKESSSSSSDLGNSQLTSNNEIEVKICPNHHKDHLITDEEVGMMVKFCCNHELSNKDQSRGKNHSADCVRPSHSAAHTLGGHSHVHCSSILSCTALDKRHVGSCCESFRKECCVHSGHFGANLRGVPEIVIE